MKPFLAPQMRFSTVWYDSVRHGLLRHGSVRVGLCFHGSLVLV